MCDFDQFLVENPTMLQTTDVEFENYMAEINVDQLVQNPTFPSQIAEPPKPKILSNILINKQEVQTLRKKLPELRGKTMTSFKNMTKKPVKKNGQKKKPENNKLRNLLEEIDLTNVVDDFNNDFTPDELQAINLVKKLRDSVSNKVVSITATMEQYKREIAEKNNLLKQLNEQLIVLRRKCDFFSQTGI